MSAVCTASGLPSLTISPIRGTDRGQETTNSAYGTLHAPIRPRSGSQRCANFLLSLTRGKCADVHERLQNAWTSPRSRCAGIWDNNRVCRSPRAINIERSDLLEGTAGERLIHHPLASPGRAITQTTEHPELEQKRWVQRQDSSYARGRPLPRGRGWRHRRIERRPTHHAHGARRG